MIGWKIDRDREKLAPNSLRYFVTFYFGEQFILHENYIHDQYQISS